jgi:DNA-binding transcriptional ArsR family regulator
MKIDVPRVVEFAKVAIHPLRLDILVSLDEVENASPISISRDLGTSLGVVSYHVDSLADIGAITEVDRRPSRGAAEHFYSITDYGRSVLDRARFISSPWPDLRPGENEEQLHDEEAKDAASTAESVKGDSRPMEGSE